MKDSLIRRAVHNCSELLCELVSSRSPGGLEGWGEVLTWLVEWPRWQLSLLPCCQLRSSDWLKVRWLYTEDCWVFAACLGTFSLELVYSYGLSFIHFANSHCMKHFKWKQRLEMNLYLLNIMDPLEKPSALGFIMGDSSPWECYVLRVVWSKALNALCFRLSCQYVCLQASLEVESLPLEQRAGMLTV